jgi:hypothetical protein
MTELPVIEVERVMTPDAATELVGSLTPAREANASSPGIWLDRETREPVLAVVPMERGSVARLRRAVLAVHYGETVRQSTGLRNKSRTFGMAPRKAYQKREACRPTALAAEQPEVHDVLVDTAVELGELLRELAPAAWERGNASVAEVSDEWRIADGSVWTSGVINKTSTLPYHRDGFNFDVMAAMPVLRRGVEGGFLEFPEYGIVAGCRDAHALMFNGFQLVHGVTPLALREKDGYRFSIVYYSLRGMKDCFTYAVEQAKAQVRRTEREDGIAAAIRGEADLKFGGPHP